MDMKPHVRLILRVLDRGTDTIVFKIEQQTLKNREFNDTVPPQDTMPIELRSSASPAVYENEFCVRGHYAENDDTTIRVVYSFWHRIRVAVLMYNQANNKNTLTEKDVIWTQ